MPARNNAIILDASAILALINKEPGGGLVESLLSNAIMSSVNVAEVLTVLKRTNTEIADAAFHITNIVHEILPFSIEDAVYTASLYQRTRSKSLSLGDRACIALGIRLGIPIYTADKIWADLEIDDVIIKIIR
jgi:PIN domain nuclease of toxin-antitoxin system